MIPFDTDFGKTGLFGPARAVLDCSPRGRVAEMWLAKESAKPSRDAIISVSEISISIHPANVRCHGARGRYCHEIVKYRGGVDII